MNRDSIHAFPKIFTIGQKYILDIFDSDVEVTEKIDGSQFNFGKVDGEIHMRSKNVPVYAEQNSMFKLAINHVKKVSTMLPGDIVYHCEYLMKPKHNVLCYETVPTNHLICFGVSDMSGVYRQDYERLANAIGLYSVPVLFKGRVSSMEQLQELLNKTSVLGGCKIEGVVVKNYNKPLVIGGKIYDIMCGKFVSESFKEKHGNDWKKSKTGKGQWETYIEQYRTEARWLKAIQRMIEEDKWTSSPKDIGELIKIVHTDIIDEDEEDIKSVLFNLYKGQLLRKSTAGLAEWYKEWLAKRCFEGSSSGKTQDFESCNEGSIPSPSATGKE